MRLVAIYLFPHVVGLENCLPGGWVPSRVASRVAYWVPGIVLESVLFLFVCFKIFQTIPVGERASGLLNILVRDSMLSYGGALLFLLTNTVMYSTARVRIFS
jgi:hypothetical protein